MVAHERASEGGRCILKARESLGVATSLHLCLVIVRALDWSICKVFSIVKGLSNLQRFCLFALSWSDPVVVID